MLLSKHHLDGMGAGGVRAKYTPFAISAKQRRTSDGLLSTPLDGSLTQTKGWQEFPSFLSTAIFQKKRPPQDRLGRVVSRDDFRRHTDPSSLLRTRW